LLFITNELVIARDETIYTVDDIETDNNFISSSSSSSSRRSSSNINDGGLELSAQHDKTTRSSDDVLWRSVVPVAYIRPTCLVGSAMAGWTVIATTVLRTFERST